MTVGSLIMGQDPSSNYNGFRSNGGTNHSDNNNSSSSSSIDIEKRKAIVAFEFSSSVADLILRNPNLVHVLFLDQPCISSNKLWNALANSPKLSSIQLTNCTILPGDTLAFWEACSKTETLHLLRLKLPNGEEFYPPMKAPLSDQELLLPTITDTIIATTTASAAATIAATTTSSLSSSSPPSPPSDHSPSKPSLSLFDSNSSSSPSPALSVSPTNFNNSNKKDEKALFSRLQSLQMAGINEGFRIIAQAPLIRSWQWSLGDKPFPCQAIEHTLPRLKTFRFFRDLHVNIRELSDTIIEELLDRMTDARDLNLNWTDFGTKSFQVLMIRHSTTLRSLHLMCYQIQSKQIQTLLTTCSGLEEFGANVLLGTELVLFGAPTKEGSETNEVDFTSPDYNYDMSMSMQYRSLGSGEGTLLGDDWVCLSLKSLALNFSLGGQYLLIDGKSVETLARIEKQRALEQEHTFHQLSRLTQLERLHMVNATEEPPFQHGVNLKLKAKGGRLEDLATLTKLEHINFAGTKQSLEEDDVTWMWEHWPRLKFILGVRD
ncbi:hypothetical protein BGZ95_001488 [Linnemannia exigua]|uniref:RNI-like protein n=1 Tax=Linnemannia exigua TaxID=604196 RepID=A0AAD4HA55_9FUNG|nr:hypothetical protein BGZ95_001488 [Linnemannia exigua]